MMLLENYACSAQNYRVITFCGNNPVQKNSDN